ncbi:MAG: hypothetical protein M3292_11410, partial [Actinomycetota bacterium]|nr:hypothetical protein [Actinomycetota bacterium]
LEHLVDQEERLPVREDPLDLVAPEGCVHSSSGVAGTPVATRRITGALVYVRVRGPAIAP